MIQSVSVRASSSKPVLKRLVIPSGTMTDSVYAGGMPHEGEFKGRSIRPNAGRHKCPTPGQ